MKRGRPVKSEIRQRIAEILYFLGSEYGYKVHKIYCEIFPKCTREVVYYHLRKGVKLGEFEIAEVKQEKGDFSWGGVVEKTYYKLGPEAKVTGNQHVKEYFDKHPELKK